MKITIVRTGGIAGIRAQLGPVDTLELGAGGQIVRKVQEIDFFELPEELSKRGRPIPDGFSYAMTVDDGDRQHTVRYGDDSEPAARTPLFELQRMLILNGCRFKWDAPQPAVAGSEDFSWEAWYNRMPGTCDPDLHVVGSRTFETSSIQLVLEPGNIGTAPEPDLFVLKLTVVRPGFGDDRMTEKHAIWIGDAGPGIERVRIVGDADAEFPATIIQ